jgi:hypothetical protein
VLPVQSVIALVQPDPNMPLNDDTVSPGLLGFGVFVALAVVVFFLVRSMNKRMRNIQAPSEADLEQQEWERAQAARARAEGDSGDGPDDRG